MWVGQRLAVESMADLPYLFFVMMRSSKSLSITVSAFAIGYFLPKKQHVKGLDVIFSLVTTAGLIAFNYEVLLC